MANQSNNTLVIVSGLPQTIGGTDTITIDGGVINTPIGASGASTGAFTTLAASSASISGDVSITGDLTVNGDIVSRGTVNLLVQDSFIDLGAGNSSTTAAAGGFTVAMNRASGFTAGTATNFVAGSAGVSNPTFTNTDAGSSTPFAAGDVVAITGAADANNDGLFVVASVSGATFPQTVTIKGVGTTATSGSTPWAQTQFTAGTGNTASAYKISLSVLAYADGTTSFKNSGGSAYSKGTLLTAYTASAVESDFTGNGSYTALTTGSTSLQTAYNGGATITTASSTDIAFTLTSGNFVVNGAGSVDFGGAGTDLTAFTVSAGTATLASTDVFDIDAVGALSLNSSGAAINIGNDAVAQAINVGTGAAARTITIGNTSGATQVVVNTGTGGVDVNSGGVLSLDSTDTTNLTMTANSASNKVLTVQAINNGAGRGDVLVQADDRVAITSGTTTTITVQDNLASAFAVKGNVNVLSVDTTDSNESVNVDGWVTLTRTSGTGAIVQTATAGTALSVGDVVTVSGTSGKVFKAEADSVTDVRRNVWGVCSKAAAGDGSATTYAIDGIVSTNFDGNVTTADIGKFVYLAKGPTPGQATLTAPASGARVYLVGLVANASGTAVAQVLLQRQFIANV